MAKKFDPSIGSETTFDKRPDFINKEGRPVSIRQQLKDLLEAEGNVTMPASQVVNVNDNGSVVLKLPTQMQLAMKLSSWAMSKKGNDSLKAIQMIIEQIDGRPMQPVEMSGESVIKIVNLGTGVDPNDTTS